MRLTTLTDYAIRLLLMAEASPDALITIESAATRYKISRAHLMKVANVLTRAGYLKAVRGRSGGLKLAIAANEIRIGDVIRITEPDFALVECFTTGNQCVITGTCRLPRALNEGLQAFIDTLNRYTIADIALEKNNSNLLFGSGPKSQNRN
jgi:Rrf2 family transcriptional regulator, nitric oxide-sensitive transcriptional repressor